jgi:cytochrome P450
VRGTPEALRGVLIGVDRPERWMDGSVAERAKSIPGLWGSTLAFSGGSHSCIGYKFSLYECVAAAPTSLCLSDTHTGRS